jgi:hypothetical protein
MSVNATSGHSARAHLSAATAYVNAKPEQQKATSAAAKKSAFVAATPATPTAEAQTAGRTVDVKL